MWSYPASREDLLHVTANMTQDDLQKHRAMVPSSTDAEIRSGLVDRYGGKPGVFAFGRDGETLDTLAIVGMLSVRPNVVTVMMLATPGLPHVIVPLTRWLRAEFSRLEGNGVHRIESLILSSQAEIRKWLPMLGLEQEAEFRAYGARREDHVQFARVSYQAPPRG